MMKMENEIISFQKDLSEYNIHLSKIQIDQFLQYYELMIEWNSFMNLTAITDFSEVVKKHYVDSISLIKAFPDLSQKSYSLIDVGTGAGFPGFNLGMAASCALVNDKLVLRTMTVELVHLSLVLVERHRHNVIVNAYIERACDICMAYSDIAIERHLSIG